MSALRIERDGNVLRITLARPETRNAFDAALIAELAEAFSTSARPAPCSSPVTARASAPARTSSGCAPRSTWTTTERRRRAALRELLEAVDRCPAPVVARLQGHALGGGAGLVACADVAIASTPDAVFAFSEVKLGIIPAVISPFALAKIGPSARAALLRHRRALRRRRGAPDRARARGRGRPRRRASRPSSASSRSADPRAARARQAARPRARPTRTTRRAGSPSAAPATKARTACAPSSSAAPHAGAASSTASIGLTSSSSGS